MSKVNYTFKRSEKKFLVNREVYNALFNEINEYILPDAYGNYTILNIYFDTEDNYLIRNSLEKPIYKEKLRLRSYGVPNSYDMVFLEIKKKYKGVVYKRRVSMQLSEAIAYINGESSYNHNSQIMKEIDYFFSHYDPMPKTFIAYEREAFYAKEDKDLRITVDSNIRSRNYDLSLCAGDYGEMLLKEDLYLMEIKATGGLPMWLVKALNSSKIYPTSFSKYGSVYKKSLVKKKEIYFKEVV